MYGGYAKTLQGPRRPRSGETGAVGVAHGDYRFDNTVLGRDHRILAVLDLDLCTLGIRWRISAGSSCTGPTPETRTLSSSPLPRCTPASHGERTSGPPGIPL